MKLQSMEHAQLQDTLARLNQAIYNHQQWHNDIIRTMICKLACDKHDLGPEAYKECRFGQWLYSNSKDIINDNPSYIAIRDAHIHLHDAARILLTLTKNSDPINPTHYDNFSNSLEKLRLEIYSLQNEIELLLYNRDPLTMATNRVSLLPFLREQQSISCVENDCCYLAMIDIDHFKNINDTYGHAAGDKILSLITHYFIEHLRPQDKVFRFGGEEFLIYLKQVRVDQAHETMDKIRQGISEFPFNVNLATPLHVTISCGISQLEPGIPVEASIENADKAMYLAKKSGRNKTESWQGTGK